MKIISKSASKIDTLAKLGIFAAFLLITVFSVYIYSPVIKSNAEENANTKIEVDVGAVISLSSTTEAVVMTTGINSFVHEPITLSVTTNSQFGYTLSIEDADSNTNLVHANPEVTNVISSNFDGAKTSASMSDNTWGYSIDNGANYYYIPSLGLPTLIARSDSSAPGTTTHSVDFGVKVGVLTSGVYSDVVMFTAYTNGIGGAVRDGTGVSANGTKIDGVMQDFSCSSLAANQIVTLKDTRDNSTYKVGKLADGNCWMAENLHVSNRKLTSTDSDVTLDFDLGTFFDTMDIQSEMEKFFTENPGATEAEMQDSMIKKSAYIDKTYGGYYTAATLYGGLENFGLSLSEFESGNGTVKTSLCPKGWKLPTAHEYEVLGGAYANLSTSMLGEPFNAPLSGDYYIWLNPSTGKYSFTSEQIGENGHLLTSSFMNGEVQVLHYEPTTVGFHGASDFEFYNVRCVAK